MLLELLSSKLPLILVLELLFILAVAAEVVLAAGT